MTRDRIGVFFTIALAGTAALHGAMAVLGLPFSLQLGSPALALYLAGLAVPAAAAIALTPSGQRVHFLTSALVARGSVGVWLAVMAAQAAVLGLAAGLALLSGAEPGLRLAPSTAFGLLALGQIWVAIGEELGWRGFALPRLIARLGPAGATLILAPVWAVWHAPMFFVANSLQAATPPALFLAAILCWSAIHTAVYVRAKPSVLANMAFHACANLTLSVFQIPDGMTEPLIAAYCAAAALVLSWLALPSQVLAHR